ncbi:nucleolar and coiled-body phosphoprotein 1 [Cyclospora cayetanensis]|uniref:Nucleolar and coiled-body phosphoprotein 1 n=1 Tax=Cyclospora cayetanensis TaxID=88456 RepID=A0A6P6RVQ9_9EIME|nr:nucleolar and coiled-body phosphoprotein 1 [Cyclospora cayetanensis]
MKEDALQIKVAAAIYKFLEQQELPKTARALLKEAARREWDLESVASGGELVDLLEICEARETQNLGEEVKGPPPEGKKSRKLKVPTIKEEKQPKKKCRSEHEKETPEAGALCTTPDEDASAVGRISKKARKHVLVNENTEEQHETHECTQENQKKCDNGGPKRFQRIDDSQWTSALPTELKDNSFWKKKSDNFAVKAAEQLGRVRGKDFRHEKNKKKKATWKGCGEIPMTVNSIQFASDSE